MNNLEDCLNELCQVNGDLEFVRYLFESLRPDDVTQPQDVVKKVQCLAQAMEANPERANVIREKVRTFLVKMRFLPLYSDTGILPRRDFPTEFWRRVYDNLMPNPPVTFSAKNLLDQIFYKRDDPVWVQAVPDETWMQLYRIFVPDEADNAIERHLIDEALYALEMLSIRLAAEEMESELLRLDPSIADHDSIFIAQEREISKFVASRSRLIPTQQPAAECQQADAAHAWVMLQQCEDQFYRFRQLALIKGNDLRLTYLLERMEQILARIRALLSILDPDHKGTPQSKSLSLFRQLVQELSTEHSIASLLRQTVYLWAKSMTNQASRTGEHYVTENRHEYFGMFGRGLGAGVFIAIMAVIKIFITGMALPMGWTTLWVSLNYGLGFVIIHILHFTVATKQPAMTAAYMAEKLEHASNGSVNKKELAQLIVKVGRSQFAAILGNVAAALPVALIIGIALSVSSGSEVMKPEKAAELMHGQDALTSLALFYAAIAGVWLFASGLVAGFFDNRSLYLNLPGRIRQHPLLKQIMPSKLRNRFADYMGEHYGALWGNFFFGIMLGVTAYVGYLLHLPLDIRHVAFSVANVGYASVVTWPGIGIFLEFVFFALLIGVVNLTVSFIFALNVAVRSRGIRLGGIGAILGAFWQEVRRRPWELFIPPASEPGRVQQHAHQEM